MDIGSKILFITGSRADYGKLKSLINESENYFDTHVFVCGMHLMEQYGNTYIDIVNDGNANIYLAKDIQFSGNMDIDLANTIISLNKYINIVNPDLIVCHGDRIDALAGSIIGMLNNILVAHIEGGEVTGTVDEAIRHSITKMSHFHFVSNYESKLRILQLGELEDNIHIIGSPDIDIMKSLDLDINLVKKKNNIEYDEYGIFIYHPVTTELDRLDDNSAKVFNAISKSKKNYIIIYPNSDFGSQIIINKIKDIESSDRFRIFKSIKFEEFLCLLKNANYIIGNSSAGIREACVYGIPAINIGTRQSGRYNCGILKNIQEVSENEDEIIEAISNVGSHRIESNYFGDGKSAQLFIKALINDGNTKVQKKFIDLSQTKSAIDNYINEVCF